MRLLTVFISATVFVANLVDSYVICPYCDPNHVAFPNLQEAMRGYDVPMGNPNPGRGHSDPGIRNQIFVPMFRNQDGHYRLNIRFVTANTQIKCDATWFTDVYDSFSEYVDGKVRSLTSGFGIEVGPAMSAEAVDGLGLGGLRGKEKRHRGGRQEVKGEGEEGGSNQEKKRPGHVTSRAGVSFPHLFSRSWSKANQVDRLVDFFAKERGSIVKSEAVCLTHKVDIADRSRKYFVEPFIDSVKALYTVKANQSEREAEFRRFVNEFGTHYASTTELGTKLTIERRYSAKERSSSDVDELKRCNTLTGARLFGLQAELNRLNCSNRNLQSDRLRSGSVERMVVSTYGSFIAESLSDWSQQVIHLVQQNAFSPRPIKRELRSILHLLDNKNFQDVELEEEGEEEGEEEKGEEGGKETKKKKKMDMKKILEWMVPMMRNYCQIFKLDCNKTGCGIDDNCRQEEYCLQLNQTDYKCVLRNVSFTLPNGSRYVGQVDKTSSPHGLGRQLYPQGQGQGQGGLEYEGRFRLGQREGLGLTYYRNGRLAFNGTYRQDKMNGPGLMYYETSGKILFNGTFSEDNFLQGSMYREDGSLLAEFGEKGDKT